jgi:nucleoside-diphosphate-sugar epimerase
MNKILVTGCAGFIGSHLTERLLKEGNQVYGLDNFSRFYGRSIKEDNLSHFRDHPRFTFYEVDIRERGKLHKCLNEKVDLVVHIAAKAGVRPSIENPQDYIDVNISGSKNVLDWMVANGCKKLVFASSSSVYGNQEVFHPFTEDQDDTEPISPYAFTKRAAELANHVYHHLYEMDIINLRFFTVYGPRQRPDLAIHKFIRMIHEGEAITIYGDGETARDYTFISDIVQGIRSAMDYVTEREKVFETINLGNNQPVYLKDLVKLIFELMQAEPRVVYEEMKEGDVNITYANIEKAKRLLDYAPTTSIREGLMQFINWYNHQYIRN